MPKQTRVHYSIYFLLVFLSLTGALLTASAALPAEASRPFVIQKAGGKFGLVNERGKQVLPARYDSLQYTRHKEYFIAYLRKGAQKQQAGLINIKGKELISISFAAVRPIAPNRYAVLNTQNKAALFDEQGTAKTAFLFDEITAFYGKLARFYQQGKAGIMDLEGTIKVPANYQDVIIHNDHTVDAIPVRKWTVTDGNNKLLNTLLYDSIRPLGEDRWAITTRFYDSVGRPTTMTALTDASGQILMPYQAMQIAQYKQGVARITVKGRYGLIDLQGKDVLPPEWDSLGIVQEVVVAGMRVGPNWYWHLFDLKGNKKSQHTYQHIVPVNEGPLPAKRNDRWGYLDASGAEILMCRYDTTLAFEGALARVRYQGLEGIINREGLWQISPVAEHITLLSPTRFIARMKNGFQLLDQQGTILFETANALKPIIGGIAEITPARKWGLIDLNGKRLSFPLYDHISDLQEGLAFIATIAGQRGILSPDGSNYIAAGPSTWEQLFGMHEGFIGAQIGSQQGFVDTNGKLRIANRYDSVGYFSDGMAAVSIRGKWGFVDKIERIRVQPLYDAVQAFEGGTAIVQLNNRQGIIDNKGQRLLPVEFDKISRLSNGRFLIQQGNQFGLADNKGNRIISPKYDTVQDLQNGYLMISKGGKKGLITVDGVATIPLVYEVIIYDPENKLYLCSFAREGIQRISL